MRRDVVRLQDRDVTDDELVAAAASLAAATCAASVVAVREHVRGEPFGLRLPRPVLLHVLAGAGSGVSAPWPLPLAALVAAPA